MGAPRKRRRFSREFKIEAVRLARSSGAKRCTCASRTRDGKPQRRCFKCGGGGLDPDFRLHDLRHQAATKLRRAGVDTRGRMAVLSRKRRQESDTYTSVSEEDRQAAAAALGSVVARAIENGTSVAG